MPTVRNPHRREVRYARQASENACAFCRLLAIRPEAQYETEASALFAGHEMGKLYHDECHCTAVGIDPGETVEMPDYTEQWVADYVDARDDPDVESFEDVLNHMRRAQYARDNPKDEDEPTPELSSPTRRAAAIMMDNVVTKSIEAQVVPIESDDSATGDFHAILSTEDLDRDSEELDADDWLLPLPARIHVDTDHGMSVEKTAGSAVPTLEGRQLHVRGVFASPAHAQLTRTLVKEGHIDKMSVTYRVVKDADGNRKRELLSGAFVAVPANPNAVVLSAKAAKTDDDKKAVTPLEARQKQLDASGNNPKPKHDEMIQATHDAMVHLGAQCTNTTEADTGEDEGANKAVAPESSNTKSVGSPQESPDDSPADAATKAAAIAPAKVPVEAADESADDAAIRVKAAARGRKLAIVMGKNTQEN